jgi:peptide/nickel transport system permease protein
MLHYAFRRMLWVFPSVLGVSLVSFFLLSLIPPPAPLSVGSPRDDERVNARRERFLDLPLFFNVEPRDVRTRTSAAVDVLRRADPGSDEESWATRELTRLGGAMLPVLLPRLDELKPDERLRVALALAPLADRMRLTHDGKTRDSEHVVLYWNRFWETRGVEFQVTTARSAVHRFKHYGGDARVEQVRALDTFALPVLVDALTSEAEAPGQTQRLTQVLSELTGRRDSIGANAPQAEVDACVERWQRWWLVYQNDFQTVIGADRVAAFALETRYGKWVFQTIVMRMGNDDNGEPVLDQMLSRARITLTVLLLGMALAYLLAIPLGSISAWYRGRGADRIVAAVVLVPYAASPAVLALVAVRIGAPFSSPMLVAVIVLGLVMLADPVRHQRAELLPVLAQEYVRASIARGAGPVRTLLVHGPRNAMLPVATRAALELPVAVTAVFVIEKVLGLAGLGEATLDAVTRHDTGWLMALALAGSVFAVVTLVVSDVAYALLDPRLRSAIAMVRRRRA